MREGFPFGIPHTNCNLKADKSKSLSLCKAFINQSCCSVRIVIKSAK